ncbi:SpoIIE family protein phosphatase [bacterium]|nr:SpoIIE family protein phosphatase [bacterium]
MPRLILIEGPRSGDYFQLSSENYLGFKNGTLALSHANDLQGAWGFVRGSGERYELANLGPRDRIQVNGEAIQTAWLHHGDLIAMANSLMIFDSDESGPVADDLRNPFYSAPPSPAPASPSPGHPAMPSPPPRTGAFNTAMLGSYFSTEDGPESSGHRKEDQPDEKINYRQKAYQDHEAVLKGIADARRIKTLLKVSSKTTTMLDLNQLLVQLLDIIFEELPADRGSILLFDGETRRLRTMAAKSRREGATNQKVRISKTIVKEALKTKESILSADAQSDARFNMGLSIVEEDIRSALCVPLVRIDKVLGIIHLDTFEQARAFTKDDCDLLTAIAMQASLAIENARLVKEMAEKERLKYEMNVAAHIQKQLLPKRLPRSREVEVYGKMIPAKELGGDYFDFMDDGGGEFHICIGDVSGKGLPAGIVMVMARSYFRPLTRTIKSPRQILCEANRLLHGDVPRGTFMSALLLHWKDEDRKFVWSGAGHEHLIVYRARTRQSEAVKAGGCVLAAIRDADRAFVEHELQLEPGDALVLYTDGVTEARNPAGEFFAQSDLQPLQRLVDLYGHLSAKDLLEAILWELKTFMGDAEQADDITVVTVKKK